jgi:sulfonate transport system substrate-binding protein
MTMTQDKLAFDRRAMLKGAMAAVACSATSSLGIEYAAAAEPPLKLGTFSVAIDYAPYLIAKAKRSFEPIQAGAKPEYTTFQSLPPINESLATDRIDAVFEAEPPALIACAAGIDVKIVGISCSLVQEILVQKNSKAATAADLRGAKIAVLAGTSSHYGLIKILGNAGLKPNDVHIIDMIPPDAKGAFETGQVDAWAVWPPFVEQEEITGIGRVLPKGDALINSIMAVRGTFAAKQPDKVKAMVAVINNTKAWMIQNPTDAKAVVAKELAIPLEVVERAWPRHDWGATLNDAVIADMQSKANFLYEMKYVSTRVDVAKQAVDLSYLDEIRR